MAKRENISVSFTREQAEFLASCVESGRYQSTSEAVREGVRLLEDQQAHRKAEIERARAMVHEGADQLDQGHAVNGDTFFKEWDAELDELEAASQQQTGRQHTA